MTAAGLIVAPTLSPGPAAAVPLPAAGTISTVMGLGRYNGDGGAATEASFGAGAGIVPSAGGPDDLAVGPDGSLYIADTYSTRIRRVTPDGKISTVAVVKNGDLAIADT
ncbi:MAG TPA: hypothetical protein VHS99_16770, partial [Chloroflexota bacterium]|nr:hypothetical protein [Chloroflexota bacterium]